MWSSSAASAYPPGIVPPHPARDQANFWDPARACTGCSTSGAFAGSTALVSSGLGGGSLIYANVLLRKDERWFVHERPLPGGGYEHWPITRADLDPHYDAVEQMLGATPYPLEHEPYDATPKTARDAGAAAERRGLDWHAAAAGRQLRADPGEDARARASRSRGRAYGNIHGAHAPDLPPVRRVRHRLQRRRRRTRLDHTYLSAAWHAGADMRTRCEVRGVRAARRRRLRGRLRRAHAETRGPADRHATRCRRDASPATAWSSAPARSARRTCCCATAPRSPGLSRALGTRFSGNGDLLTFAAARDDGRDGRRRRARRRQPRAGDHERHPRRPTRSTATGRRAAASTSRTPATRSSPPGCSRCSTSRTRCCARAPVWRRLAAPAAAAYRTPSISERRSRDLLGDWRAVRRARCRCSAWAATSPTACMRLRDGRLDVDWTSDDARASYFERVRDTMRARSPTSSAATFLDNPLWLPQPRHHRAPARRRARWARTPARACATPYGEVFGYPGLHVADGSVMPGPVGANPSLTIAALADRFADAMLEGVPEPGAPAAWRAGSAAASAPGRPGGGPATARRRVRSPRR